MNFSFNKEISLSISRWWVRFNPIYISCDEYGTSFELCSLRFGDDGTEDYDKEYSVSVFTYLNVKYMKRVEVLGFDLYLKFE